MKQLIRTLRVLKVSLLFLVAFIVFSLGIITLPISWAVYYIVTGKDIILEDTWFIRFVDWCTEIKNEE